MSLNQVAEANLDGYGPPIYPQAEIWSLTKAYTSQGPEGFMARTLDAAARACHGFDTASRVIRTSDDYVWRRIIEFKFQGKARVAVAFPGARRNDCDGSQLDRSPAVYIAGGATETLAKAVLVALARTLYRR